MTALNDASDGMSVNGTISGVDNVMRGFSFRDLGNCNGLRDGHRQGPGKKEIGSLN